MALRTSRINRKVIWENSFRLTINIVKCGSTITELVTILSIERKELGRKCLRNLKGIRMVSSTSRSHTILESLSMLPKVINQLKINNMDDHRFTTSRRWPRNLNWSQTSHLRNKFARLNSTSQLILAKDRLRSSTTIRKVKFIESLWRSVVLMLLVQVKWTMSMIKKVTRTQVWTSNNSFTLPSKRWNRNAILQLKTTKWTRRTKELSEKNLRERSITWDNSSRTMLKTRRRCSRESLKRLLSKRLATRWNRVRPRLLIKRRKKKSRTTCCQFSRSSLLRILSNLMRRLLLW